MIVQEPNRRDPRVRKRRAYTLLVDYPAEPTSPRTFNNEDGEAVFAWPAVKVWFTARPAYRRADLLRCYGATVTVVESDPITWPENP
jgi:hypothetical protein